MCSGSWLPGNTVKLHPLPCLVMFLSSSLHSAISPLQELGLSLDDFNYQTTASIISREIQAQLNDTDFQFLGVSVSSWNTLSIWSIVSTSGCTHVQTICNDHRYLGQQDRCKKIDVTSPYFIAIPYGGKFSRAQIFANHQKTHQGKNFAIFIFVTRSRYLTTPPTICRM